MKTLKATKSVRSIRSTRSLRSTKGFEEPKAYIGSFDNLLLVACAKYSCPYTVSVKKEIKEDEYYKMLKQFDGKPKSKRLSVIAQQKSQTSGVVDIEKSIETLNSEPSLPLNAIIITMVHDYYNTLAEICIHHPKVIPKILLKIIGILVPHYRNLVKLSITCSSTIDLNTIYEISKILNVSTITELCLDGSSLHGVDCTMCFESTNLQSLSLCRCNIDDYNCKLLASKLHHTAPAHKLLLLNLSSNHVTDEGAKDIAFSLRTNRHLRYLNLADNHITDDGAGYLFDVLIEFPLSDDEIFSMRQRRLEYYKCRETLYAKYLAQCRNNSIEEISHISRKSSGKRKKISSTTLKSKSSMKKDQEGFNTTNAAEDFMKTKAEMMTSETLGPFEDPFCPDNIKMINNNVYCCGNVTLAYLNLAYNNLSFVSIKKLNKVLIYQNSIKLTNYKGLVKIVLDGNNLPESCAEMANIEHLLLNNRNITGTTRRKTRSFKNEN